MACQVKYLSSAGIQKREVKGVDALAGAYPINWLMYASLNAFPKNSSPIEIDVIVVMDDRIVLLELKDWNGKLTSNGDVWLVNGGKRGRSPVILGSEKAKKVKGMIKSQIPQLSKIYVDSRVVLTATSTREFLPPDEQPYVLTIAEAMALGDRKERDRLLGSVNLSATKPNMFVKEFARLFGNATYFQPLKMSWDGYGVTDEDFYVHRNDVWREHRAHLNREERMKALLRLWRFDNLPTGLNEPNGRQLIADRELKVAAFLGEQASWMAERGVLKSIGTPPEEVLTQHHQLVAIPSGWTTLRRYLVRNGAEITGEQRVDIIHTLALMVAELHSHGVSHRDIGGDAVWLGAPTDMSLTGFFSATIPDEKSVSDFLGVLGTYADAEPDWDGVAPTAKERDVRSLGLLMRELAQLDGDSAALPAGWNDVADRALAAPGQRYPDARVLAEALGELRTPSGPTVDQSRLDAFETPEIPYGTFPPAGPMTTVGQCTRYNSGAGADKLVVKVWNSMTRGDAHRDHALLSMLEAATSLKAIPLPGTAPVVASGLSPVGPFIVTNWVEGVTLDQFATKGASECLDMFGNLIRAVDALHARGLSHGDLHPENVIVAKDGSVTLIDVLDISPVGAGRVRSSSWAPEDHERKSDQQIDRFAVCRMIALQAEAIETPEMTPIAEVARAELGRFSIETLEPIIDAVERERRQLLQPAARAFRISAPGIRRVTLDPVDGHLWVKAFRTASGVDVFWVTGLNCRLLIRIKGNKVDGLSVVEARLADLGQGISITMRMSLDEGSEEGVLELVEFLRGYVTPEEYRLDEVVEEAPEWEGEEAELEEEIDEADGEPVLTSPLPADALDVSRLWLRSAEIEEETVLRVRLDRRLPDAGNAAIYKYETPQPLEFEDEDIVEIRLGGMQGRKVGLLDVPRCDDRQLAIRDQRSAIAEGEFVSLVDRRDRVSKERRRRAVERITRRSSVIAGLIDYFDPGIDAPETQYDLSVSESDLSDYGLNEGQQSAFRELLRIGPVGMLQGPPGSGKTRFIASLSHWLLTKGNARRVLIASQSHEAVNNVLEEVLKTYRALGGHADLLRVGSRGATERVRPYQARSLRERYRIRFQNGLKTRVAQAASAAGVSRSFVHDLVDIDQKLGRIQRSIELAVISADADAVRDERRRSETRMKSLLAAFSREATQLLDRDIEAEVSNTAEIVEEAYTAAFARHQKASPGDLSTVRRLLALANEWTNTLASGHRNFDEFLAKTRSVVAGTCVGLGQSQIRLEEGTFDWVIVDEAARCTSGELAVPLQLGTRVVLVGDQRQLRPMIDRAVQRGLRDEFRAFGPVIAQSDFERAFGSSYGKRNALVLDEQYRMTPVISDLVSDIFYAPHGVKLKPSDDRMADTAFADLPSDLCQPVVWFNTSDMPDAGERDRNDHRDIWNNAEIETVLNLLHRLSREQALVDELSKRPDPPIGIICMYSEQKRRIEREWSQQPFSEAFRKLITIDTVDGYQGKENAIVIVTLVRANSARTAGHVARPNRCNVAMSRAKERLYIVGNGDMWSSPKCDSPMRSVFLKIKGMKTQDGEVRRASEIGK